jgi:hypothetical protein
MEGIDDGQQLLQKLLLLLLMLLHYGWQGRLEAFSPAPLASSVLTIPVLPKLCIVSMYNARTHLTHGLKWAYVCKCVHTHQCRAGGVSGVWQRECKRGGDDSFSSSFSHLTKLEVSSPELLIPGPARAPPSILLRLYSSLSSSVHCDILLIKESCSRMQSPSGIITSFSSQIGVKTVLIPKSRVF